MHIEEASKTVGEHGRIQSLMETFISQAARWWDSHQSCIQTWVISSTYFIEKFGGRKLTVQAQIPKFAQGLDLDENITRCEKELDT